MFFIKKLVAALLLPPAGPILLALLGLWLGYRRRRAGLVAAACALALLLVLSLPLVSNALRRGLEDHPPITVEQLAQVEAIVVLGGGNYIGAREYGGDTVGSASLERIRYAAWLHRRQQKPILVTGGAPAGGRPEAETMKEVLEREFGVPVAWVEAGSRDTPENALYSAEILRRAGVRRIALISHGWHLPRGVALFERQGLAVTAAPIALTTDTVPLSWSLLPSAGAMQESAQALREWLGRLVQTTGR
ncbi:hypothetical protein RHDC4_00324 [Rhodocyclaceae bacterium]|nr:hypothetical protein RHDC4_00324 [Rhodocyclaceae bacterium]